MLTLTQSFWISGTILVQLYRHQQLLKHSNQPIGHSINAMVKVTEITFSPVVFDLSVNWSF